MWTKSREVCRGDEMKTNFFALATICVGTLPFMSCASQPRHFQGHVVHVYPSSAFNKAVTEFSVSKEQAFVLATRYREAQRPEIKKHAVGSLAGIVGRCYVISLPQKDGIPLSGLYVNGDNGSVEERKFPYKIVNGHVVSDE